MGKTLTYQIKLDVIPGIGIKRSDGIISDEYNHDFYIDVPIYRDVTIDDYVDIEIDPTRATVERQLINPFFMELGFFEDIHGINEIEVKAKRMDIDINK